MSTSLTIATTTPDHTIVPSSPTPSSSPSSSSSSPSTDTSPSTTPLVSSPTSSSTPSMQPIPPTSILPSPSSTSRVSPSPINSSTSSPTNSIPISSPTSPGTKSSPPSQNTTLIDTTFASSTSGGIITISNIPVSTVIVTNGVTLTSSVIVPGTVLPPGSSNGSSGGGRSHTGAIAGGVVGGILGAVILGILAWYLSRRRRSSEFDGNFDPDAHLPQPTILPRKDLDLGGGGGEADLDPNTDAQPRPWNYPDLGSGTIPGLHSNGGAAGAAAYYYNGATAEGTGGPPEMSQYDPSVTSGSHYPTTVGVRGDGSTSGPSESANGGYGPNSSIGSKAMEAATSRYGSGHSASGAGGSGGGQLGVINRGEMDEIEEDGERPIVVARDAGRLKEVEIPPAYDTIAGQQS